jgi:DNA invertase Pin-like site-specific DNA recombinase
MPSKVSPAVTIPVPVAQYVRMSDEAQQYSVDNQKAAIQEYAFHHGFTIVKTYADLGKSGVAAKHRTALRELLRDVASGTAVYKAVLVYDVSRWGRFPNNDEAAHYEFLCSSSGIPLHYCAEPFVNDGTASSALLKALKRSMAAEFSRELGEKVFRGKTRIVQLGFWVGGPPGYGYRRLMVSATGKPKQVMKPGEQKSLTTDRVILIPGPRKELEGVRAIFSMAADGNGPSAIARELNRKGIMHDGRPWSHETVHKLVTNPKYMGCNVWNRRSHRLKTPLIHVEPQLWIRKTLAFSPIVNEEMFQHAQAGLPRPRRWSDEQILKRIRRLLKVKGRLSETILQKARGMPSTVTIHNHFGRYRELYERIGYRPDAQSVFMSEQMQRSIRLRRALVDEIAALFPKDVVITKREPRARSLLLVDNNFIVSVLFCRPERKQGIPKFWRVDPFPEERDYIALLCTLNERHDKVLDWYVFPTVEMWKSHRLRKNDPSLRLATKLDNLSDFYTVVKRVSAVSTTNTISAMGGPQQSESHSRTR